MEEIVKLRTKKKVTTVSLIVPCPNN